MPEYLKSIAMRSLQYWHSSSAMIPYIARGDVPDEWRQENVSPDFKKGDKYDAANYRPVSLTCICCKTLEHVLVSNINIHLALDSILASSNGCHYGVIF